MALSPETQTPEQVRVAEQRERQAAEAQEALQQGAWAFGNVLSDMHPEATTVELERALLAAYSTNPHQMVSWGDEGHKRPAWFRGFNARLAQHFGIATDDKPSDAEMIRDAMNGRSPDQKGSRIRSMAEAMEVAKFLTEALDRPNARRIFWAEDRGTSVSPRYAVIRGFVVGEPVSYGFNGDSYIAGRVTKITSSSDGAPKGEKREEAGYRIITVTSAHGTVRKFWRRGLSGSFKFDQTWSLQHGWHNDRNPSF